MTRERKMVGVFCDRVVTPKSKCEPKSFRWVERGHAWLNTCCLKGQWNNKASRCKSGLKLHVLRLKVAKSKRCGKGAKRKSLGQ